ncbi:MAG TPA: hydrogenase maturation nickel metallochaperone HypA [Kofleriaceae bacterium]|nr:hydrogenase maturation nickel metallochaperone HypA [Kofleriaceae bacterium]
MHELALMESLVDTVTGHVQDDQVIAVSLEVGQLCGADGEALRFCFVVCAAGTPLQDATLNILSRPGRGRCSGCGATFAVARLPAACACGSFEVAVIDGAQLKVTEVEVRPCARLVDAE